MVKSVNKRGDKPRLGRKLRRLRSKLGVTQVQMAGQLGLSASYLNLIEHDQRPLTLKLLLRLGEVYGIDLNAFAEDEEARLAAELAELFADPALGADRLESAELSEIVAASAPAARGIVALYRAHRRLREEMEQRYGERARLFQTG